MSKPTPGPWRGGSYLSESPFEIVDGDGTIIAEICEAPNGVRSANARLIAAAPELLEALMQAAAELDESAKIIARSFPVAASLFSNAAKTHRAAIAKATGGTVDAKS